MERLSFVPKAARRRLVVASAALALLAGCTPSPDASSTEVPRSSTAIGGVWVSPENNAVISGPTLDICAKAYPGENDPPIDYVNITGDWQNRWRILGTVTKPNSDGNYCVREDLVKDNVPRGKFQISFDVFSSKGRKSAPNDVHVVYYVPK